jgi:hypothetical protein
MAHLLAVAHIAHLPQQRRTLSGVHRHIARRVPDSGHDVLLRGECYSAIEEWWPKMMH